jgi:mannose-1-phosphate guanylyltransferase
MIQKTVKRLLPLVDAEDIFIVTNSAYIGLVHEQLPDIPQENILAEPCARNTAPCIAFAAAVIGRKYEDAVMLVLPSDHLIGYEELYASTLKKAIKVSLEGKNLVTIGITPDYPETGYGYINFSSKTSDVMPDAYEVERFVEKPDLATAKEYLASGKYLWNSGMFVWKVSSIMENLRTFMPAIYDGAVRIGESVGTPEFDETLRKEFYAFTTIPGSFGWDVVGNWLAVERINEVDNDKNYIEGNVISIGSERATICGGKRLIAAVGVEDIIIVDTDDAVLVCSKNNTQDVKKVIAQLNEQGRTDLV